MLYAGPPISGAGAGAGSGAISAWCAEDLAMLLACLARLRRVPDHQTGTRLVLELARLLPSMSRDQVGTRGGEGVRGEGREGGR